MSNLSHGFYSMFNRSFSDEMIGLPSHFKKIESVLHGFQRSRYWLVGGVTGSGKTAFVDDFFVLDLFDWWYLNYNCSEDEFKISWEYNSMERNRDLKIAKWTAIKLYKDVGVLISPDTLIGATKKSEDPVLIHENQLKIQYREKIDSYKPYFDEMEKHITIYSGGINPTGIYKRTKDFAKKHGTYKDGKYVYNHPNHYVFIVNDHVGKLNEENGLTDKGIIDKHSRYMGLFRDVELFIPVDIYQFNRSMADSARKKNDDIYPRLEDFKGSGDGTENCDYALGLFEPSRYNLSEFNKYDVDSFISKTGENRFRSISILKNSYGNNDVDFGLGFLGEVGKFHELPKASELVNGKTRNEVNKLLKLNGK